MIKHIIGFWFLYYIIFFGLVVSASYKKIKTKKAQRKNTVGILFTTVFFTTILTIITWGLFL
jgi:hypothetical protein